MVCYCIIMLNRLKKRGILWKKVISLVLIFMMFFSFGGMLCRRRNICRNWRSKTTVWCYACYNQRKNYDTHACYLWSLWCRGILGRNQRFRLGFFYHEAFFKFPQNLKERKNFYSPWLLYPQFIIFGWHPYMLFKHIWKVIHVFKSAQLCNLRYRKFLCYKQLAGSVYL